MVYLEKKTVTKRKKKIFDTNSSLNRSLVVPADKADKNFVSGTTGDYNCSW